MLEPLVDTTEVLETKTPKKIDLDKFEFKPWPNRFLVKREDPEAVTAGGLVLPDVAQETKSYGTVVSVGDKVKGVKKGDIVLFVSRAGFEMPLFGPGHVLLEATDDYDADVLGIFVPLTKGL